jgi:hypothetical protein
MKTKFIHLLLAMIVMVGTAFTSNEKENVDFKYEIVVENDVEYFKYEGVKTLFKWKPTAQELLNIKNEESHGVTFVYNQAEKQKTGYLMPVEGTNGPCGSSPSTNRYYYETSQGKYYCCNVSGCSSVPCPYCPGGGSTD